MNAPEKISILENSAKRLLELGDGSFSLHAGEPGEYHIGYTLSSLTARWVSVKERLPENDGEYFVRIQGFQPDRDKACREWCKGRWVHYAGISHWLDGVSPIPEEK